MASTNSTRDGLGFEEMNQVEMLPSNINIAGSVTALQVSGGTIYGNNTYSERISGTYVNSVYVSGDVSYAHVATIQNLYVDLGISGAGFQETGKGRLYSNIIGSPATYSGRIQTGSFATNTGSQGFLKLGNSFSSANWYATITPCGSATNYANGYISGLKHASGANFVGAASLRYDFIAVGP